MSIYYDTDLDTFLDNEFKTVALNKRGQPRRRKAKEPRIYFTEDTENAIIAYNLSLDPIERSKIYDEGIHYAFFKLTQNIIHTFKFYHTDIENIEDLQHEIIIFLLSKIHLYHHSRNIHDRLNKIIVKII
jgi:hypothetical protein